MKLDDIIQQPGQKEILQQASAIGRINVCRPGKVVRYDEATKCVDVQPTVRDLNSKDTPPLLTNVPVIFFGGFTCNISVGDECVVIFADMSTDGWWQTGDVSNPVTGRRHDLSDGFAIVGIHSLPNAGKGVNLDEKLEEILDKLRRERIIDMVYPVGAIYMSVVETSPATLFGGTWEQLKDRFLLGAGDVYTAGDIGGNASHTLTTDEMPSHNHSFTGSAVNTGKQSAGHTHKYTDYYATTTGGHAITVAQMPSHTHDNRGHNVWTGQNKGYGTIMSDYYFSNTFAGTAFHIQYQGSNNSHTHSGANTSTTRTSDGISANHTHSVTASGTIGNSGSGTAFSIMPPYLAVYMWKRTA